MKITKQELGSLGSYGYLYINTKVGIISYHYQQTSVGDHNYSIKEGRDIYEKLSDLEKDEIYDLINETLIQ